MSTNFIKIPDNYYAYPAEYFCIPNHYLGDVDSVLIPFGLIEDRVEKLAMDIFQDYVALREVTLLCILKGGHRFFADLTNKIQTVSRNRPKGENTLRMNYEFIQVQSYKDMHSTGKVTIKTDKALFDQLKESVTGKDVLIVEDIIDSGNTMIELQRIMHEADVKSLKVASLLVKRTPLSCGYRPEYIGFEIPNQFIVGYALDYNQHFRDLNHICTISDIGKSKYASIANGK